MILNREMFLPWRWQKYILVEKNSNNSEVPDCVSNEGSNLDLKAEQCYNFSFKILIFKFEMLVWTYVKFSRRQFTF